MVGWVWTAGSILRWQELEGLLWLQGELLNIWAVGPGWGNIWRCSNKVGHILWIFMGKESTVVWKPGEGTSSNWRMNHCSHSGLDVQEGLSRWMCRRSYRNRANNAASPVSSDLSIRDFLNQDQYHLYQEAINYFFFPMSLLHLFFS